MSQLQVQFPIVYLGQFSLKLSIISIVIISDGYYMVTTVGLVAMHVNQSSQEVMLFHCKNEIVEDYVWRKKGVSS
jgi:hypothetical protein